MLSESLMASKCQSIRELLTLVELANRIQSHIPAIEGVGLLKNAMHILKCNVVSGSIISKWRDIFCCATKIDWEWGTIQMLCFHYVFDCVDDHTSSCDQCKTKNRVHAHLEPSGNNKGGWATISGEIWQVKLECHQ
jgi:hypothetical protein